MNRHKFARPTDEERVVTEIGQVCGGVSEDVKILLRNRLELGRSQYGPLNLDQDHREWLSEALEEALDGAIYSAAKLVQTKDRELEPAVALFVAGIELLIWLKIKHVH